MDKTRLNRSARDRSHRNLPPPLALLVHDVRHPLLLIKASVDRLLDPGGRFGPPRGVQRDLLDLVQRNVLVALDCLNGATAAVGCTAADQAAEGDDSGTVPEILATALAASGRCAAPEASAAAVEAEVGAVGLGPSGQSADPQGLTLEIEPTLRHVRLPRGRRALVRTISNLLGNAVRHASPPVRIRAALLPHKVAIDVTDRGPGLPAAVREFIADPTAPPPRASSRRRRPMGIASVLWLVEGLGGTLRATPRDDGPGTMLTVEIPTDREEDPPLQRRPHRGDPGAVRLRVGDDQEGLGARQYRH